MTFGQVDRVIVHREQARLLEVRWVLVGAGLARDGGSSVNTKPDGLARGVKLAALDTGILPPFAAR
jgi:hypothetical protein